MWRTCYWATATNRRSLSERLCTTWGKEKLQALKCHDWNITFCWWSRYWKNDNCLRKKNWNTSVILNCFKNKGEAKEQGNYLGLKLLEHMMKVFESHWRKAISFYAKKMYYAIYLYDSCKKTIWGIRIFILLLLIWKKSTKECCKMDFKETWWMVDRNSNDYV